MNNISAAMGGLAGGVRNAAANLFTMNKKVADYWTMSNKETGLSERRQQAFLERSSSWMDPAQWTAKKILGMGSYGLVTLFNYVGKDKNMPPHIVVKQSSGASAEGLMAESKFLHMLASTGTEHFVKIYKAYHRAGGTGTHMSLDEVPYHTSLNKPGYHDAREVARYYMEYCPNGDLQAFFDTFKRVDTDRIPEEHLWRMLMCLAKACLIMETGIEEPDRVVTPVPAPSPDQAAFVPGIVRRRNSNPKRYEINHPPSWRPICHFDIKPANILVGARDAGEHSRLQILKMCDMGLSVLEPATAAERQDTKWIKGAQWRATPFYMAPEQYHERHPGMVRDIGTPANVWMIGSVMHQMITGLTPDIACWYLHSVGWRNAQISVVGDPVQLFDANHSPYSRILIQVICECLAVNPDDRINSAELVAQCQEIIDQYDAMSLPNPPMDSMQTWNNWQFNRRVPGADGIRQAFSAPVVTCANLLGPPRWRYESNEKTRLSPTMNPFQLLIPDNAKAKKVRRDRYPFTNMADTPLPPAKRKQTARKTNVNQYQPPPNRAPPPLPNRGGPPPNKAPPPLPNRGGLLPPNRAQPPLPNRKAQPPPIPAAPPVQYQPARMGPPPAPLKKPLPPTVFNWQPMPTIVVQPVAAQPAAFTRTIKKATGAARRVAPPAAVARPPAPFNLQLPNSATRRIARAMSAATTNLQVPSEPPKGKKRGPPGTLAATMGGPNKKSKK